MIINKDGGKTMVLQWHDDEGFYSPAYEEDDNLFSHFSDGWGEVDHTELENLTEIANLHGVKIELKQVEITQERIDLAQAEADEMLHRLNDR